MCHPWTFNLARGASRGSAIGFLHDALRHILNPSVPDYCCGLTHFGRALSMLHSACVVDHVHGFACYSCVESHFFEGVVWWDSTRQEIDC